MGEREVDTLIDFFACEDGGKMKKSVLVSAILFGIFEAAFFLRWDHFS